MMAKATVLVYAATVGALSVRVLAYGDGDGLIPLFIVTLPFGWKLYRRSRN